jgi:curli biogenesis system outer membrane secretion channel CsgG
MRRVVILAMAVLTVVAPLGAQQKKRVAVMNFDYGTVRTNVYQVFGGDTDVGKGISDLLVQKLVQDGAYSVIERAALDKVLAEQNFSNSDRADSSTAAKIGRVLGVDAIITGTITQFGRDDKNTTVGGGGFGGITSKYGLGGVKHKEAKAVVAVTARLIDTSTAEILAAATGTGHSERSGTSLVGGGGGGAGGGGGLIDMSSSNFANTILGQAVTQAVNDLGAQLDQNASRLPTKTVVVEGLVADASAPPSIILNVGTKGGVKVGDHLVVSRKIRDIKDPATGNILRSIENKLGEVVITEADEGSSVGTYTGSTPAKVGDKVKTAQ